MITILFTIIILAQLIFIAWLIQSNQETTKKLIKALLSDDVTEFTNSEIAEKVVTKKQKEKEPDLVPLAELSDEDFNKAIKNQLKKGE